MGTADSSRPSRTSLHRHGLLPPVFEPYDAHTLRNYVRQRGNLVRLSGQHIQRLQKALELMNLKLKKVLGDITGVTGLKVKELGYEVVKIAAPPSEPLPVG